MNEFKIQIIALSALSLMAPIGHAQGNQPASSATSAAPLQVQITNLYPIFEISNVLKKNKEAKTFKLLWVIKGGFSGSWYFQSTDILYDREKKTLKFHFRENNVGIRRSYLYTNVTDESIHQLVREAEETQRKKKIAAEPRSIFDGLIKFGCQQEEI